MKIVLAGAGAFGQKPLDAIKVIGGWVHRRIVAGGTDQRTQTHSSKGHSMKRNLIIGAGVAAALGVCTFALADEHGHEGGRESMPMHGDAHPGEAHEGPRGYQRVQAPHGWDARPQAVDRDAYRHNFQAAHSFHIGPYHTPPGWHEHRWVYGEILPRGFWVPRYILADYWLFALEVPPVGFEWVRVGADAVMISVNTGEVLQVEYGVFA